MEGMEGMEGTELTGRLGALATGGGGGGGARLARGAASGNTISTGPPGNTSQRALPAIRSRRALPTLGAGDYASSCLERHAGEECCIGIQAPRLPGWRPLTDRGWDGRPAGRVRGWTRSTRWASAGIGEREENGERGEIVMPDRQAVRPDAPARLLQAANRSWNHAIAGDKRKGRALRARGRKLRTMGDIGSVGGGRTPTSAAAPPGVRSGQSG
jgi:hypothetical protein